MIPSSTLDLFNNAFPTDSDGFLIPVRGRCEIQPVWGKILKDIVQECTALFQKNAAVYVRGSVAAGTAQERLSDVDIMIIVPSFSLVEVEKTEYVARILEEKYPIASGIDLELMTIDEVQNDKSLQLRVSTEAIHLSGPHVDFENLRFMPSKEIVRHAPHFQATLIKVPEDLEKIANLDDLQRRIVRAAKQLIRLGMELVIERSKTYSRELSVCIEIFSYHYPAKKADMEAALFFVEKANTLQLSDKAKFISFWNDLGQWLCCRLKEESF